MSGLNATSTANKRHHGRDPDETRDISELIAEVIPEPELWKDAPNANLGGRTPRQLITGGGESFVRNLVRRFKHGMFS